MALTAKKLDKIEKTLRTVYAGDPALDDIVMKLDGARAAVASGEVITKGDLEDILGDVQVVDKSGAPAAVTTEGTEASPMAPIFMGLFKQLVDESGTIRKGINTGRLQELVDATYQKAANLFDQGIDAAVQATAAELGTGTGVIGKAKGKNKAPPAADCEDDEDMEKLLKSLGVPAAIAKKVGTLEAQVAELQHDRDVTVFKGRATELGESEGFAEDLLKLHTVDPKLAERISKRLGAKNQLLKQNRLWSEEIGGGGALGEGGTASDRLNAMAKDMIAKGEKDDSGKTLTFAKAYTAACARNPDLYAEYRDEQERSRR